MYALNFLLTHNFFNYKNMEGKTYIYNFFFIENKIISPAMYNG
jgi:hypothetical protein